VPGPGAQDMGTVTKMYTALAIIPTVIGLVPYLGATLLGKTDVFPLTFGLGFAATFGLALTVGLLGARGAGCGAGFVFALT